MYVLHRLYPSSAEGHLGYFRVLAVVNGAAMSTGVCAPFQIMIFCGCVPRSGSAESYDSSIFRGYFFLMYSMYRHRCVE